MHDTDARDRASFERALSDMPCGPAPVAAIRRGLHARQRTSVATRLGAIAVLCALAVAGTTGWSGTRAVVAAGIAYAQRLIAPDREIVLSKSGVVDDFANVASLDAAQRRLPFSVLTPAAAAWTLKGVLVSASATRAAAVELFYRAADGTSVKIVERGARDGVHPTDAEALAEPAGNRHAAAFERNSPHGTRPGPAAAHATVVLPVAIAPRREGVRPRSGLPHGPTVTILRATGGPHRTVVVGNVRATISATGPGAEAAIALDLRPTRH